MSWRAVVGIIGCAMACGEQKAARPVEVDVVPVHVTLAGKDVSARLDDAVLADVQKHADVSGVFPRMLLRAPSFSTGIGIAGFADGIPTSVVAADPAIAAAFVEGATPAPMIISPESIELYNSRMAEARGTPKLDEMSLSIVIKRKKIFPIVLGPGHQIDAVLVGVSRHAAPVGVTFAIGDVARWNRELAGSDGATTYESLQVTLRDVSAQRAFEAWLRERGMTLRERDGALAAAPPPN